MAGAGGVYTGGGVTVVMDPPPVVYVKVFHRGSGPEKHLLRKAEKVAQLASDLAPKGPTLRLSDSIRVDQTRDERGRFSFGFYVYTPVYYGLYVHEGTQAKDRVVFPGQMKFMGTNAFKGRMIYTHIVHHPGNSAQPFLRDALAAMAG